MIQTKKKPKKLGILPIVGLIFAALLIAVAYGLSPLALKGLGSVNEEWDQKLRAADDPATAIDESADYDPQFRYLLMAVIWLVLMSFGTIVVASATRYNPDREILNQMVASPANKKAMIKELKRGLKEAERRAQQQRKQKGK